MDNSEKRKKDEEKLRMLLMRISEAPNTALYAINFYEETAKKEIEKYNKNKKEYKFQHINFFYNNDFMLPHISIPIFIMYLIENNYFNLINYMIKDKRTVKNFLKINIDILSDHIQKQTKLNQAFLNFYSIKEIQETLKIKCPREYQIVENRIKITNNIAIF